MRARPHDGGAAGFTGGRARRALTLIEVMVALAVMAALAAVVLPAALSRVREAGVGEIGERIGGALVLACVEAQRRGEVLEVVAQGEGSGDLDLWLRPLDAAAEGEEEPRWIGDEPLATLPAGVRVAAGDGARGDRVEAVVAVVLPDGTVEAGETLILEDGGGGRLEVRLSRWDGRVTVERVAAGAADGDGALTGDPGTGGAS